MTLVSVYPDDGLRSVPIKYRDEELGTEEDSPCSLFYVACALTWALWEWSQLALVGRPCLNSVPHLVQSAPLQDVAS